MDIEFDSAARLAHLARVAKAKSDEARDLQNRRNSVGQLIAEKRREQSAFAPKMIDRDETRFAEYSAEISALEAERDNIDEAYRIANAGAFDTMRLHAACNDFAAQNGLPRPSLFSTTNSGGVMS